MKPLMGLIFLIQSFQWNVSADVNFADDPNKVILVATEEVDGKNWVSFDYCEVDVDCEAIGTRTYSEEELGKVRNLEYAKAGGLAAFDAGLIAGSTWLLALASGIGTAWVADMVTTVSLEKALTLGIVGGVVGGTTGAAGSSYAAAVTKLNPARPFKKGRTVRKVIIQDQDVVIKGISAYTYVQQLEDLLEQIDNPEVKKGFWYQSYRTLQQAPWSPSEMMNQLRQH